MNKTKLLIAIISILIILGLIAVVSKTNTSIELQQIDLRTKQQEIETLQEKQNLYDKKLEEAKGDEKKLKQLEIEFKQLLEDNRKLQSELQAKRDNIRNNSQNVAYASPQSVTGDCTTWMTQAGISHPLARELIQRESGCNHLAVNSSSGACGIPQSLPCSKMGPVNPDGTSAVDPVSQLIWMQNYVFNRYTTWEAAIAHHNANNWY